MFSQRYRFLAFRVDLTQPRVLRHFWPLLLVALAVPAMWPFLTRGLPTSFDGATHLLRLSLLDHDLAYGPGYPRWMPEIMLSHGAPILNYYGPLSYYLAEVLHLAGATFSTALMLTMGLFVVIGGCGMFLFASDVYGGRARWAALVAAITYMYAPYLLTNVFIRAGVAEVGALAALPWVLWSVRRLMHSARPEIYVLPAVLSMACLAVSHAIALLLVPPLLAAYVLILWRGRRARLRGLLWLAAAVALAAGTTAFFWAPVVFERHFLGQGAYETAREIFMPRNVWHWSNFLNLRFQFNYNFGVPVQLGLVSLILCLAGAVLAFRRDPEWLFFVAAALLIGLSMGAWALPIWLSSPILLTVQFPWRLLSLLSILMALLTGGVLVRLSSRALAQVGAAAVLIGVVIASNGPRLAWMQPMPRALGELTVATAARYEKSSGSPGGAGYTGEFTPRWVGKTSAPAREDAAQSPLEITLQDGNAFGIRGMVTSPTGGVLRFPQSYFPGWQVSLDDVALRTYPSNRSGLLAVDVPPGTYSIRATWTGTPLERGATLLSLLTLAVLAVWIGLRVRPRWLCLVPLALLAIAALLFYRPAAVQAVQSPSQSIEASGMRLLGYHLERNAPDSLIIYPYWLITRRNDGVRMRWQLKDPAGHVISEAAQAPYFDTANTADWPAGTLVRDAVELALPADLPPASYSLDLRMEAVDAVGSSQRVGSMQLPPSKQPGQARVPAHANAARFGSGMYMAGYDLSRNGRDVPATRPGDGMLTLNPGDVLEYTIYWKAAGPVEKDYRARVELVDSSGIGVSGLEQVAGGFLHEPTTWDPYRLRADTYRVTLPDQLATGLYSIQVHAYDPDSGQPLDVTDQAGGALGDTLSLHLAKDIDLRTPRTQHTVGGKLGEAATFLGYDLAPQSDTLKPGEPLTVTLYYQAHGPMSADYTRFVQLLDPDHSLVAQQDGYPASGQNPTHTWLPGEVIADAVTLTAPPDARPGDYTLTVGFYDLQANLQRLPLRDAQGRPVPDNMFTLRTISVR